MYPLIHAEINLNGVIEGDCLELLPEIPAQFVDLILCDLPYGTTRNKWDSVIPLNKLWEQYKRVLKPFGVVVLTASQPFTTLLAYSNLPWLKCEWIWRKNCVTGHLNVKRIPMKEHENILVFAQGSHLYNPQGLQPYGKIKKRGNNGTNYGKSGTENFQEVTGYPRTILEFASARDKLHPTQKPVALFEYLIRTYTNEGDVVLDNCCGSGTTGVACHNLRRNFIQIEKDPAYAEIAWKRLLEAQKETGTELTKGENR